MLYTYIVLPENEVRGAEKKLTRLKKESKLTRLKKENKFTRLLLPENDVHRKKKILLSSS